MNLMFPPNMGYGYPNLMGNGMGAGMGMMEYQGPSMVGNTAAPPSAYAMHRTEPTSPALFAGIGALVAITATALITRGRGSAKLGKAAEQLVKTPVLEEAAEVVTAQAAKPSRLRNLNPLNWFRSNKVAEEVATKTVSTTTKKAKRGFFGGLFDRVTFKNYNRNLKAKALWERRPEINIERQAAKIRTEREAMAVENAIASKGKIVVKKTKNGTTKKIFGQSGATITPKTPEVEVAPVKPSRFKRVLSSLNPMNLLKRGGEGTAVATVEQATPIATAAAKPAIKTEKKPRFWSKWLSGKTEEATTETTVKKVAAEPKKVTTETTATTKVINSMAPTGSVPAGNLEAMTETTTEVVAKQKGFFSRKIEGIKNSWNKFTEAKGKEKIETVQKQRAELHKEIAARQAEKEAAAQAKMKTERNIAAMGNRKEKFSKAFRNAKARATEQAAAEKKAREIEEFYNEARKVPEVSEVLVNKELTAAEKFATIPQEATTTAKYEIPFKPEAEVSGAEFKDGGHRRTLLGTATHHKNEQKPFVFHFEGEKQLLRKPKTSDFKQARMAKNEYKTNGESTLPTFDETTITPEGSGSIAYSTATPESVKKANNPFAALLNYKTV